MRLESLYRQLDVRPAMPMTQWDPPLCGDLDLIISAEGFWIHEGVAIERPQLVQLFQRVLRREPDAAYYLVTPVEKLRIQVEDLPLMIVDADLQASGWTLTTQCGETFVLGTQHRFTLKPTPDGEYLPAVHVRHGLEARLHRNVFYRLVEAGEEQAGEIGLTSGGVWHPLGRLDEAS